MDDEQLVYPFYEKIVKAGHDIVCVHKGLYPPSTEQRFPNLTGYATVDDVGKAAKDWPQIRFVIYHSAFRWTGAPGAATDGYAQFEKTGRVEWTSDLAEIPAKYGVSNVYADLGQIFAQTTVVEPRLCAALMGMLIKGMGADHVVWGTDALWTGAPQWQIEGLRRLEIPEDMRKKYGFAALGPADGPVKRAIFGENSARMYRYEIKKAAWRDDRFAAIKSDYERRGRDPSNLRYGYVLPKPGFVRGIAQSAARENSAPIPRTCCAQLIAFWQRQGGSKSEGAGGRDVALKNAEVDCSAGRSRRRDMLLEG